jgi:hypothetical protein
MEGRMKTSDIYKDMITTKIDRVYHDGGLDKLSLEDLRGIYTMLLSEIDSKDHIIHCLADTITIQTDIVRIVQQRLDGAGKID